MDANIGYEVYDLDTGHRLWVSKTERGARDMVIRLTANRYPNEAQRVGFRRITYVWGTP